MQPKVGFVRSSSDLDSYDNSTTSTIVCDHSSNHARNEPNTMKIVALASQSSGHGPTCFDVRESGAAFGATSKQQRHLPGVPPKDGLCRFHEVGKPHHPVISDDGSDASFNVDRNTITTHPYATSPGSMLQDCDSLAVPRRSEQDPRKSRRTASHTPSVAAFTRKEIAHTPSTPFVEASVGNPSPTRLSHRYPVDHGQSIRCINGNLRCAKSGWTIKEYCEACHG